MNNLDHHAARRQVNASGQFVGLAEMTGPVDFKKTMDFWQLDKWNGFFPVRWCVIKDIPNSQLRHIVLANNDNKPVTNSRDTQEINQQQGSEMLDIFKSYPAKASMLDDFDFYDIREKLKCQKHLSLHTKTETSNQPPQNTETRSGHHEWARVKTAMDPMKSLITLTRDLSLKP
ncbi:ethanolamine-phosphate cytidylyltransferase [Asimina triloba]